MSSGDTAFLLLCGALVFIMIPGLGYFYSGMANTKSALSMLLLCFVSYSIVMIQWFLFGYSLVFNKDGGPFIGTLNNGVFKDLTSQSGTALYPDFAYAFYQSTFAGISPALVIGATAERARILPKMIFIFLWSTFVYDFIAYWSWGPNGWLKTYGSLDFAGGSPVHIASGAAALAYAMVIGKRKNQKLVPHSASNVILGTTLLWFGWNGFNGGSAAAANGRAAAAIIATNLAASAGSLTWMIVDYIKTGKFSAIGFCSGAVAGLVSITPGSGFVSPGSSIIIGFLGALACNFAAKLTKRFQFDDTLDVFAVHGVGGIVGNILTGFCTERYWPSLDGTVILYTGVIEGDGRLLAWQIVDCLASFSWSFCVTGLIVLLLDRIPGLSLRLDASEEELGIDISEMGEVAFDYVHTFDEKKKKEKKDKEKKKETSASTEPLNSGSKEEIEEKVITP